MTLSRLDAIGIKATTTSPGLDRMLDPDAAAVVVFTSGTTSSPKGVIHSLNSLRCGAANMTAALGIDANDAFSLSSPLGGITGLMQLHAALTTRAAVIFEDRFSPPTAVERICELRASIVGRAPFIAESILDEALRQHRDLPLRRIAVGGSAIPATLLDKAAALGIRTVRVYGSSEAPVSTATDPCSGAHVDDGVPMPGVEVTRSGPDDELLIRGPHQFHGYLDSAHNDGAFIDGWIRSGDQADIEGGRIRIKGRLKELVVRKGMKVSLNEIDIAAACLGECAAFGVPDEATGERLALAVRSSEAGVGLTYEDVIEQLVAAQLARWKLPEQIVMWDEPLPRTTSGKINRYEVAARSLDRFAVFAPRLRSGDDTPQPASAPDTENRAR